MLEQVGKASSVGRRRIWHEAMAARLPRGTLKRISDVLEPKESRVKFVALAIERELERRENKKARKK
jgi:hypothetical protein